MAPEVLEEKDKVKTEEKVAVAPASSLAPKLEHETVMDIVNWVVLLVVLGAVGGSIFMGWRAIQTPAPEKNTPVNVTVVSTPSPLPTLKLNNAHSRQGATVNVDPSQLGRDNPLMQP